jgi:integrase
MELLCLRRRDLDLDGGSIYLGRTKNGHPRTVPLTGIALEFMTQPIYQILPPDAWLFPGARTGGPTRIDYAWKQACVEAELGDFRFHDLRHTAASYLAMSGASLLEIADILGHRTLNMVKRYAHLTESHKHTVAARMTSRFLSGRKE